MFYDFGKTNTILKKLKISPNQAWFCIMLLEQDYTYKKELFNNWVTEFGGIDFLDIDRLEKLGYIENFSNSKVEKTVSKSSYKYAGDKYVVETEKTKDIAILELFLVTPKFRDLVYIDAEQAAEELLASYPAWVLIKKDGEAKRVMLKKVPDREAFYQYYEKITGGDILKHKYIVKMFSHYKILVEKNKIAGMNVINALESRLWLDIEPLIDLEGKDKDIATTEI